MLDLLCPLLLLQLLFHFPFHVHPRPSSSSSFFLTVKHCGPPKNHVKPGFRLISCFPLLFVLCETCLPGLSLSPASFYGDGFVQLKATESSDHNTLRVRFRTSSTNGLLFLAAGQTDCLLLELHAGRLQVGTSVASAHDHVLERTPAHVCTVPPYQHARVHAHTLAYTKGFMPDQMYMYGNTCHTM